MVRRGSTVRARQRALQSAAGRRFLVQDNLLVVERAVDMEPFMELPRSERRRAEATAAGSGCMADLDVE
jgi:hypothetical protein